MTDFPRLPPSYSSSSVDQPPPIVTSATFAGDSQRIDLLRAAIGVLLAKYGAEDSFSFHLGDAHLVQGVLADSDGDRTIQQVLDQVAKADEHRADEPRVIYYETTASNANVRRKAPLVLESKWSDGQVKVNLTVTPLVFDQRAGTRFLAQLEATYTSLKALDQASLVTRVNLHPAGALEELEALSNQDRDDADSRERYADCRGLASIVLLAASQTPDSEALVYDSLVITFSQLVALASHYAHRLRQHLAPGTGRVVALCLPKSPLQYLSLLAVALSGSAYLNLEPSLPGERKRAVLRDLRKDGGSEMWSGLAILAKEEHREWESWKKEEGEEARERLLGHLLDPATFFDPLIAALPSLPALNLEPLPTMLPSDPAYIIFTSGSTGNPKGIVVENRNVVAFLRNYRGVFGRAPGERVLAFPSYGFDVMVVNIWDTWAHCAAVTLTDPGTMFASLPSAILDLGITVVDLTPTVSSLLFEYSDALPREREDESIQDVWCRAGFRIKQVNTGGEKVEPWVRDQWALRGVKVVIDYGPSESTVGIIANVAPSLAINPIPIGRPIGQNVVRLLAPWSLAQVPRGCVGEICVSGEQVSRGYLRPDLNRDVFIVEEDGTRTYRTGDWGRWTEDGMIEFLGRRDGMVKINGLRFVRQRIEIGEIESRLNSKAHPDLRRGVVDRLEPNGAAAGLVAYLVFREGSALTPTDAPSATDDPHVLPVTSLSAFVSSVEKIQSSLAKALPSYMVPRYFLPVSHVPTAGMGKTDRKRLRRLADDFDFRASPMSRSRSKRKRKDDVWHNDVRDVWAQVLRMQEVDIGDDDVFSRLGGDSIGFLRVVSLLRRRNYAVSFAALVDTQTVTAVADVLREAGSAPADKLADPYVSFSLVALGSARRSRLADELQAATGIDPEDVEDIYPTAPAQDAILAAAVDSDRFYAQAVYRIHPEIDTERLTSALSALVQRHRTMRTVFALLEGETSTLQVVLKDGNELVKAALMIEVYSECDQSTLDTWLERERDGFRFEWGQLALRFALFEARDGTKDLVWSMHHALSDGWTLELLIADLRDQCFGVEPAPRPLFANMVAWWKNENGVTDETTRFWKNYLENARPLWWPSVSPLAGAMLYTTTIAADDWHGDLGSLSEKHGITPAIASRVAIAIALGHHAASTEVCLGVVRSGRDVDVEGATEMVGPCVSVLPSRIQLEATRTLLEVSSNELHADRQSRRHQRVSLADIARICSLPSRGDLFNILVTYQSLAEHDDDYEGEDTSSLQGGQGTVTAKRPWPIRQPPRQIRMPTNYTLSFEITPDRDDATKLEFSCFFDDRIISMEEVRAVIDIVRRVMDVLSVAPCTTVGDLNLGDTTAAPPRAHARATSQIEERGSVDIPFEQLEPHLEALAPLWARVLRLKKGDFGPHDTFRSLGGDSIGVMRLSVALKGAGMTMPPGTLANLPTMAAQAQWLFTHNSTALH